jgi:hypothetical protein
MKLYERFGDPGFHTSITSTFGIDFDAYESIMLPRVRGAGCRNNLLLVDRGQLGTALTEGAARPQHAGRLYSVTAASAKGVFHPKLFLQIGRGKGRVIVASANVTAAGLAGNLELVTAIECTDEPSNEQRLVAAAWRFLSIFLDRRLHGINQQIGWMENRAPWLSRAAPANEPVSMSDGSLTQFLATGEPTGLFERFAKLAEGQVVEQLLIVSPYWDDQLTAVRQLLSRLKPRQAILLIDKSRALFPGTALGSVAGAKVIDRGEFGQARFIHAKLFVITTPVADHVLIGSANCTVAALGTAQFSGSNEEACLYRKLSPGTAITCLDLSDIVAQAPELRVESIPALSKDLLPEDAASGPIGPGTFECLFDTLIWTPPTELLGIDANIEPYARDGSVFPGVLLKAPSGTRSSLQFYITGTKERPSFAQVRFADGTLSAIAIVTLADALRDAARESRGKARERLLAQLDEETEEGIWLLEAWNSLEEAEGSTSRVSRRPPSALASPEDNTTQYPTLSYDQFLAGRVLRPEGSLLSRNSLAGSDLSLLRGFLNRALALPWEAPDEPDVEEGRARLAFNLGDEVSDGQNAVEEGGTYISPSNPPLTEPTPAQVGRRRAVVRQQTREQIAKAVDTLGEGLRVRADAGHLTTVDLLRVRAILTIVAAAGFSDAPSNPGSRTRSRLQVLPSGGAPESWPRLLGKCIFSLFGGQSPTVGRLSVETLYDQVPDDIMECWATCMWAVEVASIASSPDSRRFLESLKRRVYALIGLYPREIMSEQILSVMRRLNDRFCGRLGIDASEVLTAHRRAAEDLAKLRDP